MRLEGRDGEAFACLRQSRLGRDKVKAIRELKPVSKSAWICGQCFLHFVLPVWIVSILWAEDEEGCGHAGDLFLGARSHSEKHLCSVAEFHVRLFAYDDRAGRTGFQGKTFQVNHASRGGLEDAGARNAALADDGRLKAVRRRRINGLNG